MASLTPATILGARSEIGSLASGKRADILVIDDNVHVHGAYIDGKRISAETQPRIPDPVLDA
jgi:N-acetylglucosamine-6-phosphate deacetylase